MFDADPAMDEPSRQQPQRESGTLFERMSNIARGAPRPRSTRSEAAPDFRREPIDIPRFLNRQNNQ